MSQVRPAENIPALTGVRAVASLAVVLYHFREVALRRFVDFGPFDPLVRHGYLGVDVFFVLSGFIIYHVYWRSFATRVAPGAWWMFVRNRVARIYPVHVVTLALMLGIYAAGRYTSRAVPTNDASYRTVSLLSNLVLTQSWFPGVGAPNTPAWSVSTEWFAYLLFPFACVGLVRAPRATPWVLACSLPILAQLLAPATGHLHPLVRIGLEFPLGMSACALVTRYAGARRFHPGAGLLAVLALGLTVYLSEGEAPLFGVRVLLFAALIAALAAPGDWLGRGLSGRRTLYLGEISYSLYMGHWLVWTVLRRAVAPRWAWLAAHPFVLIALGLVLSFALALALYHGVELPGRQLLRAGRPRDVDGAAVRPAPSILGEHPVPTSG